MNTIEIIPISKLEINRGQIVGLPKNPRFIRDERFEQLKKSIEDAPEMLNLRELLVYPFNGKYVVIGGNMRLRACTDLGYKEVPCKIIPEDTPILKLREYTIKDNEAFGQNDWDAFANEWDIEELKEWGVENIEWNTTNTDSDIDNLFEDISEMDTSSKEEKITIILPIDLNEYKDEIKEKIKQLLSQDYQGCRIS